MRIRILALVVALLIPIFGYSIQMCGCSTPNATGYYDIIYWAQDDCCNPVTGSYWDHYVWTEEGSEYTHTTTDTGWFAAVTCYGCH